MERVCDHCEQELMHVYIRKKTDSDNYEYVPVGLHCPDCRRFYDDDGLAG